MVSLSLYLKLGFKLVAHCGEFKGLVPQSERIQKYLIRPMTLLDVSKVSNTWLQVCGYTREAEIKRVINNVNNETPASSRPYIIFEAEECVGFTLGLNFLCPTLLRNFKVFKALLRRVSSHCDPNNANEVPQFIVPLQSNSGTSRK